MTLAFLIYAISLLPNISAFLLWFGGAFFVGAVICLMIVGISAEHELKPEHRKSVWRYARVFAVFGTLLMTTLVFVPNTKTAWMMVAGYAAQAVYESEASAKLGQIINNELDKIIADQISVKKEQK